MRSLMWLSLCAAAVLAFLAGLHAHIWSSDVYPFTIIFFGQRFTLFVALCFAASLAALLAATTVLVGSRSRDATAAGAEAPAHRRPMRRPEPTMRLVERPTEGSEFDRSSAEERLLADA